MKFGSVSSGIEAASVAWRDLGWRCAWLSEIDSFPSSVLSHRLPDVPNLGDMTRLPELVLNMEIEAPDVLVGGTPCQGFSVAGLRKSLGDDRSNLALQFIRIANAIDDIRRNDGREPAYILWENVPGVLSTDDNAFGTFLAGLVGSDAPLVSPNAAGWTDAGVVAGPQRCAAWRCLDAQHFGLAQRRKRVFVLARGHPRGWTCADALLPIIESMRWHPPPRREKREGIAPTLAARTRGGGGLGTDFDCDGGLIAYGGNNTAGPIDVATALNAHGGPHGRMDFESETFVTHSLRAEGFDASEDGTGRGTPIVPIDLRQASRGEKITNNRATGSGGPPGHGVGDVGDPAFTVSERGQAVAISLRGREGGATAELSGDVMPALRTGGGGGDKPHVLAFAENSRAELRLEGGDWQTTGSLKTGGGKPGQSYPVVAFQEAQTGCREYDTAGTLRADGPGHDPVGTRIRDGMQVRRLTPRECEALQGFPDDFTLVPYRGKPAADGPRYKALGNSFAVPVVRWLGRRIQEVEGKICSIDANRAAS